MFRALTPASGSGQSGDLDPFELAAGFIAEKTRELEQEAAANGESPEQLRAKVRVVQRHVEKLVQQLTAPSKLSAGRIISDRSSYRQRGASRSPRRARVARAACSSGGRLADEPHEPEPDPLDLERLEADAWDGIGLESLGEIA